MARETLSVSALTTLAAVAEYGSFTRAAEALGISQPSVSQQIRDLERSCGLPLVVSRGRTLAFSALGDELAALGRRIALDVERAEKRIAEYSAGDAGRLTIGASLTTAAYLVPPMLAALQRDRPGIAASVRIANTADVAQMMVDELIDVGIVEGRVERVELTVTPLCDDVLVCIAPAAHPLANTSVALSALAAETLVQREPGSGTREALDAALPRDATFARTIDIGGNDAIVQAVRAGLGIAWLSRRAFEAHRADGLATIDVTDVNAARAFSAIRRRDTALTPAAATFVALAATLT
jgi:DNA-binding transcriptional LysR family regulator